MGRDNYGHYPSGKERQKRCSRSEPGKAESMPSPTRTSRQKAMYEKLMEEVVRTANVERALVAVKRNGEPRASIG